MSKSCSDPALSIAFDEIRASHSLTNFCESRGIILRRNGSAGRLVGLCPLHEERSPSFTVFPDGHFFCYGCGHHGDITDLTAALDGISLADAARKLGGESIPIDRSSQPERPRPEPIARRPRPAIDGLRFGTDAELQQFAHARKIRVEALEQAQRIGTARVADVCGFPSIVLLDQSGRCMEARRLDNQKYPAIPGSLGERKAHTIKNSQKSWPVGISAYPQYLRRAWLIALVEGTTDYFAALHFAHLFGQPNVLPSAMLSRAIREIHPKAHDLFRGRRIRIFPHEDADGDGCRAGLAWGEQLERLGCDVDFFSFDDLTAKDLNDCASLGPEFSSQLEVMFL